MNENTEEFSELSLALGERRLLAAILRRAVLDYLGDRKELIREAEIWLFHPESKINPSDYSFSWICLCLDLDPVALRRKLEEAKREGPQSEFRGSMESAFA